MSVIFYGCISMDGYLADRNYDLDWLYESGSPEETEYNISTKVSTLQLWERGHLKRLINEMIDCHLLVDVLESFKDFFARKNQDEKAQITILRKAPLIGLTIEEMISSIGIEYDIYSLLERLEVDKLLAYQSEKLQDGKLFPLTNEIDYIYDFGDYWEVKITKLKDCEDLLKNFRVNEQDLQDAQEVVLSKHQPVCINREGINVVDDAGGLHGFADLLGILYEGTREDDISFYHSWAKEQGFSEKKASLK